jgi:MOSC N-terminal beta barrel domain
MANPPQIELGSVVSLWRYPVKSMLGEQLSATEVTEYGLLVFRIQSEVNICHGILREGIHGQPCPSHHGPRRGSA